jgi:hypothetical protein
MRLGSGATVAALPLAAALTAATQGWSWLVWTGGTAFFLVLALTFAPWIRGLQKLPPPLGAPRARITFTEIPQSQHRFGAARLLEVGVRPSTRLGDAVVNFQFPRDMYVQRIDAQGQDMKGAVLPIHDSPSPISWWASEEDIRAGSKLLYFLLFPKPEDYPFSVTMLIQSEKLYRGGTASSHELERPSETEQ